MYGFLDFNIILFKVTLFTNMATWY